MTTLMPIVLLASVLWFYSSSRKEAFITMTYAVIFSPIYATMIYQHRRRLIAGESVLGTVESIMRGTEQFSGCLKVVFSYEFSERMYSDDHLTGDKFDFAIGESIWIIVNPNDPTTGIPWL
ncbi:MAG: hypothetical protein U0936_16475 [Planctomycetaceae bacterium]